MADKHIRELPSALGVYGDTLLVAEQQGQAVKITAGQIRMVHYPAVWAAVLWKWKCLFQ